MKIIRSFEPGDRYRNEPETSVHDFRLQARHPFNQKRRDKRLELG